MADVAAKREARRRKILENSEYRLQRIIGHANNDENLDKQHKNQTVEAEFSITNLTKNGVLTNETNRQNEHFLHNSINENDEQGDDKVEEIVSAIKDILNEAVSVEQEARHRRNAERNNGSPEYGSTDCFGSTNSNCLQFSNNADYNCGIYPDSLQRDIPNSTSIKEPSLFSTILSSRIIYVVLAIVTNFMVVFKLEYLFGTSIILPFFIVTISRLFAWKNDDADQDNNNNNNMLVAALILLNCRPYFVKTVQRLKSTFSLFGKIFRDLSVYIFTFILCYTITFPYKNDHDEDLIKVL